MALREDRRGNPPEQNLFAAPWWGHRRVDISADARLVAHRPGRSATHPTRKIGRDGETRLSQWMRDHLAVAVHPFEEHDALADLEHRVLAQLNPPLNLEGRPASGIRAALTRLRAG